MELDHMLFHNLCSFTASHNQRQDGEWIEDRGYWGGGRSLGETVRDTELGGGWAGRQRWMPKPFEKQNWHLLPVFIFHSIPFAAIFISGAPFHLFLAFSFADCWVPWRNHFCDLTGSGAPVDLEFCYWLLFPRGGVRKPPVKDHF